MKKKQQHPFRIQGTISTEMFDFLNHAKKDADATLSETVRYYLEQGIQAEKQQQQTQEAK